MKNKIAYFLFLTIFTVIGLEIGLRFVLNYNPSYYMGFKDPEPNTTIEYPYGEIRYNSDKYPDDEFSKVKTKKRIAYIGDSVNFGVGAGYGYRVSEMCEKYNSEYEHMNFSFGMGTGMARNMVHRLNEICVDFEIDSIVYLMNLNDILPGKIDGALEKFKPEEGEETEDIKVNSKSLKEKIDFFRGRSYLFTHIRFIVKKRFTRKGIAQGMVKSYELYPSEYEEVFSETCERIIFVNNELEKLNVGLLTVILPYEMQISTDAAAKYKELGIVWGEDFLDRGAQKIVLKNLENKVDVVDAFHAFTVENENLEKYKVGETFVYNRGDKMDWNHPNRLGHKLIASFLSQKNN